MWNTPRAKMGTNHTLIVSVLFIFVDSAHFFVQCLGARVLPLYRYFLVRESSALPADPLIDGVANALHTDAVAFGVQQQVDPLIKLMIQAVHIGLVIVQLFSSSRELRPTRRPSYTSGSRNLFFFS